MHVLCLRSGAGGWGWVFSSPGLPLPPAGSWGEACLGPAEPRVVSYPFHQALGSHTCRCSQAVVLCLLVSLLGLVAFVVFSKIQFFWEEVFENTKFLGGDSHCPTHAAMLAPPLKHSDL